MRSTGNAAGRSRVATSSEVPIAATVPGWIAGFLATMTESGIVFDRVPMLGFVCIGGLGGIAGWALAVETGRLDDHPLRGLACVLARRIVLGAIIGVCGGALWLDAGTASRGPWMFCVGVAATAPVEISRVAMQALTRLIRAWAPGR